MMDRLVRIFAINNARRENCGATVALITSDALSLIFASTAH
jgi:hypothetical protein